MSNWNTFLKSVPAGVMIGLGVTAFISSENKVFGSILFCLGLFGICAFGFNLFTGKIGYVIPTKNNPNCLMIWLGNLLGCLITTVPLRFASPKYTEAAKVIAENKLSQNFLQTFILGIFCGMIMYIVVVKWDKWHFLKIMAIIGGHVTGSRINKHFIVCQQIKCLSRPSPECLALCIRPVFIHGIIVSSCIVDVRIYPHCSDQPTL